MNVSAQTAKHFRDVHVGGNWTDSILKDKLAGLNWQQATTQVHGCNSIAALVFHMNYFVSAVLKVLEGDPLMRMINTVFDPPPI